MRSAGLSIMKVGATQARSSALCGGTGDTSDVCGGQAGGWWRVLTEARVLHFGPQWSAAAETRSTTGLCSCPRSSPTAPWRAPNPARSRRGRAGSPRARAPVSGSGRVGAHSMFSHLFLRLFRGRQGARAVTASRASCTFILILLALSCRVKVGSCPKPAITSRSFGRATTGCLRSCRALTSFSWTTMCFGSR